MADDIKLPTPEESAAQLQEASKPIDAPAAQPVAEQPQDDSPVNVVSPDGQIGSIPRSQLPDALEQGHRLASTKDLDHYDLQQKYSGLGQGILAGVEGAGSGGTFGASTFAENVLSEAGVPGLSKKEQLERQEARSGEYKTGEVLGLVGSGFIPGVGEANVLKAVGEGGLAASGLAAKAGAGFIRQIGDDAIKGAIETTFMEAGEETRKALLDDPAQTAETAAMHMGLATIMGGVFGGAAGAALRKAGLIEAPKFISETDRAAVDAGELKATAEHSGLFNEKEQSGILADLGKQKSNAKEITDAAERLGAPVMDGMVSDSKWIQKAEDALINGAPTYSGIKRAALYEDGYNKAAGALADTMGEATPYSKAELGNIMKSSIVDQVKEQSAPIEAMYNELKQSHDVIPLPKNAGESIKKALSEIPEIRVAPSSPGGSLAKRVLNDLDNLKTVDDVKIYKSELNRSVAPTASPSEKRIAAIIGDKLGELENSSVEGFAKSAARTPEEAAKFGQLIEQRKAANTLYKGFIEKVKTLSEQLGKGRVYGLKDATNFINDLTPEQLTTRLFAKNNSEFLKFFSKEFPEQMELMRQYQKSALKEAASRTGELSPKVLLNNINKLEPEVQKALFNPEELQKVKDVDTYLRSFPKNFNPSGTSGMSAFREAFNHPAGAAMANARDAGIELFIKLVNTSPQVKNASALAKASVAGWNNIQKASKAILGNDLTHTVLSVTPSIIARDKLAKLVDKYTANPEKLTETGANNPSPEYATAFGATSAKALQYLQSQKPVTAPKSPLDSERKPSALEKAVYSRALDIAQNPMLVMKSIADGNLTSKDLVTLQTIYPKLYNQMVNQIHNSLIDIKGKDKVVPYKIRQSLSLMLGQPLDSTMSPASIQNIQMNYMPKQPQGQEQQPGKPPAASSTKGISKLPASYQTPGQTREQKYQRSD